MEGVKNETESVLRMARISKITLPGTWEYQTNKKGNVTGPLGSS